VKPPYGFGTKRSAKGVPFSLSSLSSFFRLLSSSFLLIFSSFSFLQSSTSFSIAVATENEKTNDQGKKKGKNLKNKSNKKPTEITKKRAKHKK
jgi:hypothetical protein